MSLQDDDALEVRDLENDERNSTVSPREGGGWQSLEVPNEDIPPVGASGFYVPETAPLSPPRAHERVGDAEDKTKTSTEPHHTPQWASLQVLSEDAPPLGEHQTAATKKPELPIPPRRVQASSEKDVEGTITVTSGASVTNETDTATKSSGPFSEDSTRVSIDQHTTHAHKRAHFGADVLENDDPERNPQNPLREYAHKHHHQKNSRQLVPKSAEDSLLKRSEAREISRSDENGELTCTVYQVIAVICFVMLVLCALVPLGVFSLFTDELDRSKSQAVAVALELSSSTITFAASQLMDIFPTVLVGMMDNVTAFQQLVNRSSLIDPDSGWEEVWHKRFLLAEENNVNSQRGFGLFTAEGPYTMSSIAGVGSQISGDSRESRTGRFSSIDASLGTVGVPDETGGSRPVRVPVPIKFTGKQTRAFESQLLDFVNSHYFLSDGGIDMDALLAEDIFFMSFTEADVILSAKPVFQWDYFQNLFSHTQGESKANVGDPATSENVVGILVSWDRFGSKISATVTSLADYEVALWNVRDTSLLWTNRPVPAIAIGGDQIGTHYYSCFGGAFGFCRHTPPSLEDSWPELSEFVAQHPEALQVKSFSIHHQEVIEFESSGGKVFHVGFQTSALISKSKGINIIAFREVRTGSGLGDSIVTQMIIALVLGVVGAVVIVIVGFVLEVPLVITSAKLSNTLQSQLGYKKRRQLKPSSKSKHLGHQEDDDEGEVQGRDFLGSENEVRGGMSNINKCNATFGLYALQDKIFGKLFLRFHLRVSEFAVYHQAHERLKLLVVGNLAFVAPASLDVLWEAMNVKNGIDGDDENDNQNASSIASLVFKEEKEKKETSSSTSGMVKVSSGSKRSNEGCVDTSDSALSPSSGSKAENSSIGESERSVVPMQASGVIRKKTVIPRQHHKKEKGRKGDDDVNVGRVGNLPVTMSSQKEVCFLYVDLGYCPLSDRESTEAYQEFLRVIVEKVSECGGEVETLHASTVLVSFNFHRSISNPEQVVVNCALDIRTALDELLDSYGGGGIGSEYVIVADQSFAQLVTFPILVHEGGSNPDGQESNKAVVAPSDGLTTKYVQVVISEGISLLKKIAPLVRQLGLVFAVTGEIAVGLNMAVCQFDLLYTGLDEVIRGSAPVFPSTEVEDEARYFPEEVLTSDRSRTSKSARSRGSTSTAGSGEKTGKEGSGEKTKKWERKKDFHRRKVVKLFSVFKGDEEGSEGVAKLFFGTVKRGFAYMMEGRYSDATSVINSGLSRLDKSTIASMTQSTSLVYAYNSTASDAGMPTSSVLDHLQVSRSLKKVLMKRLVTLSQYLATMRFKKPYQRHAALHWQLGFRYPSAKRGLLPSPLTEKSSSKIDSSLMSVNSDSAAPQIRSRGVLGATASDAEEKSGSSSVSQQAVTAANSMHKAIGALLTTVAPIIRHKGEVDPATPAGLPIAGAKSSMRMSISATLTGRMSLHSIPSAMNSVTQQSQTYSGSHSSAYSSTLSTAQSSTNRGATGSGTERIQEFGSSGTGPQRQTGQQATEGMWLPETHDDSAPEEGMPSVLSHKSLNPTKNL